jgi:hypothetical protein
MMAPAISSLDQAQNSGSGFEIESVCVLCIVHLGGLFFLPYDLVRVVANKHGEDSDRNSAMQASGTRHRGPHRCGRKARVTAPMALTQRLRAGRSAAIVSRLTGQCPGLGSEKTAVLKQDREPAKFNRLSDLIELTLGPLHGHIGETPIRAESRPRADRQGLGGSARSHGGFPETHLGKRNQ